MIEPILEGHATDCMREEPILRAGNTNCGGCGMSIAYQMLSRAVSTEYNVQLVIPACCGIVTPGRYPYSAYGAPVVASTFAAAASVATGLAQVAKMNGDDTRVIAWAGDGGTYDIGMATVSAAAERNEDILYVCYDNEIYGNTGGQRSSATPVGASTTTTPTGEVIQKKDILAIMAAHRVPYAASINMADPADTMRKMKYALDMRGFRFLQVMSPCPTGWKSEPSESLELIRLAVRSGLFPVIEIFNGRKYVINVEPEMCKESLERYLGSQGRFKRSKVSVETVRQGILENWEDLRARAQS